MNDVTLTDQQLGKLQGSLQRGAADASAALAKWLGRPSLMTLESIEQSPMEDATQLLQSDDPICFCSMSMPEYLSGEMIVAFDDASGLALADMILQQPPGTATQWDEIEQSAALETTNIVCCSYLNSIVADQSSEGDFPELVPEPPVFRRDFAESLLQFALMGQAVQSDQVFLLRTAFRVDGEPLNWNLLWIPDASGMKQLCQLL